MILVSSDYPRSRQAGGLTYSTHLLSHTLKGACSCQPCDSSKIFPENKYSK